MLPDPQVLARIDRLELEARQFVEGYLAGKHRSPRHGFAVEFAQHREYSPGDDIKHIDWKVYGRTERFHLKQYEQETNLVAWLLVDASESMKYGSGARTKHEVVLFHVMDAAEFDFPFRHMTLFRGLEEMPEILTDPLGVRDSYLKALDEHIGAIQQGCRGMEIDYVRLRTDADLGHDLAAY